MVRSCAEAAECSQPKISISSAISSDSNISNCHMFRVRDLNVKDITLCVTTGKYLYILSWHETSFILRQRISTPDILTCMIMTPSSVIYGSNKFYEVDTKNFQVEGNFLYIKKLRTV